MSIKVIVELKLKKGMLDNAMVSFSNLLPSTRARSGNEGVSLYNDLDNKSKVILIEQWSTRKDYESYSEWRTERGDISKLSELLLEAPTKRFFSYLSV